MKRYALVVMLAVAVALAGTAAVYAAEKAKGLEGPPPKPLVIQFKHIPAQSFMETLKQLGRHDQVGAILEKVPMAVNEAANAVVILGPPEVTDYLASMAKGLDQPNAFRAAQEEREREQIGFRLKMAEAKRKILGSPPSAPPPGPRTPMGPGPERGPMGQPPAVIHPPMPAPGRGMQAPMGPPQQGPGMQRRMGPPQQGPGMQRRMGLPQQGPGMQVPMGPPQQGPGMQRPMGPPQQGPGMQRPMGPPQQGPGMQAPMGPPQQGPGMQRPMGPPQQGPGMQRPMGPPAGARGMMGMGGPGRMQMAGPMRQLRVLWRLTSPEARQALGLSEEQADKIKKTLDDASPRMERLMAQAQEEMRGVPPQERPVRMREMMERRRAQCAERAGDAREAVMKILRPEQREKAERFLEEPGTPVPQAGPGGPPARRAEPGPPRGGGRQPVAGQAEPVPVQPAVGEWPGQVRFI
jgi:hypothetical protein